MARGGTTYIYNFVPLWTEVKGPVGHLHEYRLLDKSSQDVSAVRLKFYPKIIFARELRVTLRSRVSSIYANACMCDVCICVHVDAFLPLYLGVAHSCSEIVSLD